MKIVQFIHALSYGDGMSNTLFFINNVLQEFCIEHKIITLYADPRIQDKSVFVIKSLKEFSFDDDTLLLFHFGIGGFSNIDAENISCKKVLLFHNVTMPNFFRDWDYPTYTNCLAGHNDVRYTVGKYNHAIVLSNFSKQTLIEVGWAANDITVFPLYELSLVSTEYATSLYNKLNDGKINILFTGRISPNKKIEDVISVFDEYNKTINSNSRLILVGNVQFKNYFVALQRFIKQKNIKNVVFAGHVTDAEREAYYKVADIFLCMSEHEGFCIPLLEAFQHDIPVIAYKATAVCDTMGEAGILVDKKDGKMIGNIIEHLMNDVHYKQDILRKQKERLAFMTLSSHKQDFIKCLNCCAQMQSINLTKTSFLDTIEVDDDEENNAVIDQLSQFNEFVIYGYGRVGKKLVSQITKQGGMGLKAICDNKLSLQQKFSFDTTNVVIITHEDCIRNFAHAVFVITVQFGFLDIVFKLKNDGVPEQNILFYDSIRQRLEGFDKIL